MPTQDLQTTFSTIKDARKAQRVQTDEEKYKYLISTVKHRTWRQVWELIIIFIAMYSVLVIPIRIGVNERLWDPGYDYIDLVTWLFYFSDVFINLRTTYMDNYGNEVTEPKKVMRKYIMSFRFIIDLLSLFNLPSLISKNFDKTSQVVLQMLGLLKLSRYFRAQGLIIESRLPKDSKAEMNCCFYFVLLLIYLHMVGCLFFFFCLKTYEVSSTRVGIIDDLGYRVVHSNGTEAYTFSWAQALYTKAIDAVNAKGDDVSVDAWVPAFDNYDGSERFWRHYELSLLEDAEKKVLLDNGSIESYESERIDWAYVWSVMIYYSVLVIGGNEMQPAQPLELIVVVTMNIMGLIFMTWIAGEIAVLVAQISIKSAGYQQEID